MTTLALSQNPADNLVAGILGGVALTLAGIAVIWFVRSAWSERQAVKAESIIKPDPIAVAERFASECDRAAALAEHTERFQRRLSPVAPVVPLQRKASR